MKKMFQQEDYLTSKARCMVVVLEQVDPNVKQRVVGMLLRLNAEQMSGVHNHVTTHIKNMHERGGLQFISLVTMEAFIALETEGLKHPGSGGRTKPALTDQGGQDRFGN